MDIEEYTREEWQALDKKAMDPTAEVICPRCGNSLEYRSAGNSYEVKCQTPNCIRDSVRGL